jgi:multidrug efflux pump subunit AcrB
VKIGDREYTVSTNGSPSDFSLLNDVPIKFDKGATVFMRDVAHVRDGDAVQQNVVRADGRPSVLLTIMKTGSVSTLSIVDEIKNRILPAARASAPKGMQIKELFDQSVFVRGSINGVLREAVIAACLTGMMILLFLGSWRSTLIIAVSIPLSILSSLCMLSAMGHTMNVMTLGGLALAIGILVDDATVTIENIHRHMGRKPLREAVLEGAAQIATPTLVSTLTICIVFVSVVFLTGPAKYLFTPMALAVVFAMLASYLLSRTLVPVMSLFLLKGEQQEVDPSTGISSAPHTGNWLSRINDQFNEGYIKVRTWYTGILKAFIANRTGAFVFTGLVVASAFILLPFVGRDFFPSVDAGQLRLHVRAAPGTRVESTKAIFSRVEEELRQVIPASEIELVLDDIGRPAESFNFAFGDGATIGTFDGEILIALKEGKHGPTAKYVAELRQRLPRKFPALLFYFQPPDIVTQILNFGLPAPIDVQVAGYDPRNYDVARHIRERIARIPGVVDSHVHQVMDGPDLHFDIDRTRAAEFGLTAQDVSNSMFVSLSSSSQVQPNFWLDPKMATTYFVAAQTPPFRLDSVEKVGNTPIPVKNGGQAQLLSNLAAVSHATLPVVANHRDVQPVFDVYANIQDSDLGSVAARIDDALKEFRKQLSPGSEIVVRGQVASMRDAFSRLGLGLVFASMLVYLLMVVNFQSWKDPFIIITALPGAFTGVVWGLFLTQSTFSVPSMMGAIMSIGVATANSILLVTFASERMESGRTAAEAAVDAGCTRLRPIVMTALAMIIGMLPMALGLGEGGEQNAPLARAVIGGLFMATMATLFFVPFMFSILRRLPAEQKETIA